MTSTTNICATDTLAVVTAASPPTITSGAPPLTSRTPSWDVVKRLRRIIVTVAVGVLAIVAVPGTAHAHTEPIRPDSGTVPIVSPATYPTSVSHASSSGCGLTTILAVVVAVLAVGLVIVAQRVARHRRDARPTAVGA